jgi:hypothetical protein
MQSTRKVTQAFAPFGDSTWAGSWESLVVLFSCTDISLAPHIVVPTEDVSDASHLGCVPG